MRISSRSLALAWILAPLSAGAIFFAIAAPPERPGVYALTRHQEFAYVPFVPAAEGIGEADSVTFEGAAFPAPLFRTDEEDVVAYFVLEPEGGSEPGFTAMQILLMVGNAGERRLHAWPLSTRVDHAGERLYRITSPDWESQELRRLVDRALAQGLVDRGKVVAYLALRTPAQGNGPPRHHLVPLGPPFLWDAAPR